ncbi:MAG: hypothetical protein SGBAC_003993 [Bacillariaceae sp.]
MTVKWGSISLGLIWMLAAPQLEASTTSTTSTPSQKTKLDLSYLHRVKSDALANVLKETLQKQSNVEIDLSSSLVGKDIKSIVSIFKDDMDEDSTIDLKARSNNWSSRHGRLLLEAVLARSETNPTSIKEEVNKNDEPATDKNETKATETKEESSSTTSTFPFHSLDLGWNNFGDERTSDSKKFLKALQKLVQESSASLEPFVLRLDVCALNPAACRAIGKGMIARYDTDKTTVKAIEIKPMSLHLTKNEDVGDGGAAALSAAIRSIASKKNKDAAAVVVFDVLNLSACGIGDTGAEALAIALEDHPSSVKHLILSNNHITDEGAAILGRALTASKDKSGRLESLDLSHNKAIGDAGAKELAQTIEHDSVGKLILRSCHIRADGISSFASVLKNVSKRKTDQPKKVEIDLSGNPIGILRKNKKSGGYSASALKSKATATTAAYMNIIGKRVQKGLKEFGLSETQSTLESDDEEEMGMDNDNTFGGSEQQETKCGALALADAFIDEDDGEQSEADESSAKKTQVYTIVLGLRHCALDTRAAEALAAVIHEGKEKMGLNIQADVRMNNVLEDDMVVALRGDKELESDLVEMAETHLEALEQIREARRRAVEAVKAAADRMRAEAELEGAWGSAMDMGDGYGAYDYDPWDSDADYDEEMDDYY